MDAKAWADVAVGAGWLGVLAGFLSGIGIGLMTENDHWLGGYASPARRYVRLGHVALAALGMLNILAGLCARVGYPCPGVSFAFLLAGLLTMPLCCFLTAFDRRARMLFPIPSLSLAGALVTAGLAWV